MSPGLGFFLIAVPLLLAAAVVASDEGPLLGPASVRLVPDGPHLELERLAPAPGVALRAVSRLEGPRGVLVEVEREAVANPGEVAFAGETWRLRAPGPLAADLEVEVPFSWDPGPASGEAAAVVEATWPRKDGWARRETVGPEPRTGEYRLGCALAGKETPALALPLLSLAAAGMRLTIALDPRFSALFAVRVDAGVVLGTIRWRYRSSRIPLQEPEIRRLGRWQMPDAAAGPGGFAAAVDLFFERLLPDVRPGPAWIRSIALVGYDFLSDGGAGWERDVGLLGAWLAPAERRRAALCFHGWYDGLGSYSFDQATGRLKEEWIAMARTRKVPLGLAEMRRRLDFARGRGFRVLLYFADGLAADSGLPGYRDDWAWRDAAGKRVPGWQGPDTFGPTFLRDPAHPEVSRHYLAYLDALLADLGRHVDGFVWDETFHVREGQTSSGPRPAYCDRALFDLVAALTLKVKAFDPEKVFLASDCSGVFGWEDIPGYGMVADGTYQDTHCAPVAWSWGLFPNWRNAVWSCNWNATSGFGLTRFGVERFGAPVAISNGWGDDRGPSEWTAREREAILALFRRRLALPAPLRCLDRDPGEALADAPDRAAPGDSIPEPAPGEVNHALAARGARARASSELPGYPAAGILDGVRTDEGWGAGHGWASAPEDRPWIEVDLGGPRAVVRIVVITYQREGTGETAGKWGVTDYRIEGHAADGGDAGGAAGGGARAGSGWLTLAAESRGRVAKARVHSLAAPVRTDRIRLTVDGMAPLDGCARLLQVEAWGPEE